MSEIYNKIKNQNIENYISNYDFEKLLSSNTQQKESCNTQQKESFLQFQLEYEKIKHHEYHNKNDYIVLIENLDLIKKI